MWDEFVEKYYGKKIMVLGLAKSGTTIAKILFSAGADLVVYDAKESTIEQEEIERLGIVVHTGEAPVQLLDASYFLLVKNPGVPYDNPLVKRALQLGVPVITEIELAGELSAAPIIGITGSNGKTTTTTLIGEILNNSDQKAVVAGNIGTVLASEALLISPDKKLVAELSSFQLKGTINFHPHIALLLNIYPTHLDYHHGIEDYIISKSKLFANQSENDYAIFNINCRLCTDIAKNVKAQPYYFSTTGRNSITQGAFIEQGSAYYIDNNITVKIIDLTETRIRGAHLENLLAAVIATRLVGADFESIRAVLRSFKGVEHRIEYVLSTKENISFYNDSKSTNVQATITALDSFTKPVILIAGGLDRGIGFSDLIEYFRNSVKGLVVYGETAEQLAQVGQSAGVKEIQLVDSLETAIDIAVKFARPGDDILLSPAAASWDMFSSFEERGNLFKELIKKNYN